MRREHAKWQALKQMIQVKTVPFWAHTFTSLTKKTIIYFMHYTIWYLEIAIVYTTITKFKNKLNQNQYQALQQKKLEELAKQFTCQHKSKTNQFFHLVAATIVYLSKLLT